MNPVWSFPSNNGGEEDGPQNAAIDTFKGRQVFAVVRETIQNSLDVALEGKVAIVSYSLDELEAASLPEVTGLSEWLERAVQRATELYDKDDKSVRFYEAAKASIGLNKIRLFGIHDYNTTGLTGPINGGKAGPWRALVKGTGLSIKSSADAGGSYGHGSKAPFAISAPQAVFYYTDLGEELRFQGKSILLSMDVDGMMTQGTGYFGIEKNLQPLVDNSVPTWARLLRPSLEGVPSVGTSIYIPSPVLEEGEASIWDRVLVAVVVNFSYALRSGNLEVRLGDGTILNRVTIDGLLDRFQRILTDTAWDTETQGLEGLEAALVIGSATEDSHGSFESKSFGHVEWFLDLSDECKGHAVAVLRRGMFITDNAVKLQRFPGTRPFRLVVSVEGTQGSTVLRSLENPEHNKFEFTRVSDVREREKASSAYKTFVEEVRSLVLSKAALDVSDETFINDLDFLFNAGTIKKNRPEGSETSRRLSASVARTKGVQRGADVIVDDPGTGGGFSGGDGTIENHGGPNPNTNGIPSSTSKRPKGKQVEDLRVVRRGAGTNEVNVSFTPVLRGHFKFSLFRSGESDREAIQFKVGDKWVREVTLDAKDLGRRTLRIELDPSDFRYAFEGVMFDASQS